ncbi:MAG: phage NrS-1 polymerase family protein [Methylocystis sp.]|uniref:phage NrS-1 polymerase family protein n=1 Tax=Methylocystis sp. TaxID=1911079 RepID=UPI003DA53F9D
MQDLKRVLGALANYRQFIVYKLVPSQTKPGKTDKFPINHATGAMPEKGSGAASIWTDLDTAVAAATRLGVNHGIGFSFADSDPFFFVDIDNALESSGQWSALALHLLEAFPGAYVEVSQSGRGLHIIGTGSPPPHGCRNTPYGLEFYHTDRFVALTGINAQGDSGKNFDYLLPWLVQHYFPMTADLDNGIGWTDGPDPEWSGPTDDGALIERALKSKSSASVFGNRASFADLWYADIAALSASYPDPARGYDASLADAALAQHLAFWTGKDCERILRIMRQSALNREKWEREDYLPRTISKAVSRQIDVLRDKPSQSLTIEYETGNVTATPQAVTGATYLSIDQQLTLFRGCVYVTDRHAILVPGGTLLKPDQFRVRYGGFSFPMDPANERVVRNAWECFTESQAFRAPRSDTTCFRPDLEPAMLVNNGGRIEANIYWPIVTKRQAGDVAPFMSHLRKVLPDERDQAIILSYMAACVQYKGVKFQWAPLLQGVEGNGKTLFSRCVGFAIGDRYVHFPKASQIASQFNDWIYGKLFIGVEDIFVAESQQDVIEELKPMITNDRLEIEGKNKDKATLNVCANFILNSNHKGAVRKTRKDRRFAHFYTAQQEPEDLDRDGMSGDYFIKLYDWLRAGGYEYVNEFLHTYAIPDEYNPATKCQRAPVTSTTEEALALGLGRVEQEILEAIEREEVGFRGGWVSSMAVDKLLDRVNASRAIPPNKRRDLLTNIGYDYHPQLVGGRVNNAVLPDGGKPRLFVKRGSELASIVGPAEVARAYCTAQQIGV